MTKLDEATLSLYLSARGRYYSDGLKRFRPLDGIGGFLFDRVACGRIVQAKCAVGSMFLDTSDQFVSRELFIYAVWEPSTTRILRNLVKPGMVVVDIGAHIGYYTLLASRLTGETGTVFAFEPDTRNFGLLRRNLDMNGCKNVRAIQMAVFSDQSSKKLFKHVTNFGAHSLERSNVKDAREYAVVRTTTLDSYLKEFGTPNVDILKIDAQGAEGRILAGAANVLDEKHLIMIMELWPEGLRAFESKSEVLLSDLSQRGFRIGLIDDASGEIRNIDAKEGTEICKSEGRGYLNLLLRK